MKKLAALGFVSILIEPHGYLVAAAGPRSDGIALGY